MLFIFIYLYIAIGILIICLYLNFIESKECISLPLSQINCFEEDIKNNLNNIKNELS